VFVQRFDHRVAIGERLFRPDEMCQEPALEGRVGQGRANASNSTGIVAAGLMLTSVQT
jgi:hypothetical protein